MKAKTRTFLVLASGVLSVALPNTSPVGTTSPADAAALLQPAPNGGFSWVEQGQAPDDLAQPPTVALHDATPELMERVEWALNRFAAAGLVLPPLDITFHVTGASCHGYTGYFEVNSGVADIEVCMPTRHIILHELAHAWAAVTVSDANRAEVLGYWGLETWNDQDVEWSLRGSEKAADTIAFALNDIPSHPRDALLEYLCGYRLLTGHPLPGSGMDELRHRCGGDAGRESIQGSLVEASTTGHDRAAEHDEFTTMAGAIYDQFGPSEGEDSL
jgi:hypothetical protein